MEVFANSAIFILGSYILLVGIVIFSAERASSYVDDIDKKTNIGGAILGGLLLAGITSLPELITTLTSATFLGQPGMAFGNIFGSNIFNVVILAIMDIYFLKEKIYHNVKIDKNDKTNRMIILMHIIIILPIAIEMLFDIPSNIWGITSGRIGIVSIIILFIYIKSIFQMLKNASEEAETSNKMERESIKNELLMLLVWSILLVISSLMITTTTSNIMELFNMNATFAGAIFLGIATSLPEFTAVYALVKKNNIDAAVGNITGSIVFNLVVLSFVDIITSKNLYAGLIGESNNVATNVISLLILGLINIIILLYAFSRKDIKKGMYYVIPSTLILSNYLVYLIMSAMGIF